MNIRKEDFKNVYPENLQAKINRDQAIAIVRGQYCRPMTYAGKCTRMGDCNHTHAARAGRLANWADEYFHVHRQSRVLFTDFARYLLVLGHPPGS